MTILRACLGMALVLTLLPARASWARPKLSPSELRKLAYDGVVLSWSLRDPRSAVRAGKAIGIVEATPEQVRSILLDVSRYHRFLYRVKRARRVGSKGNTTQALIETRMPWPVSDAWALVDLQHIHLGKRVYRVTWKMRSGTLKHYDGYALIEPWDAEGKKVTLTYRLLAEPRTLTPNRVLSRGARRVAEMVLHRVRIRAKELHPKGSGR